MMLRVLPAVALFGLTQALNDVVRLRTKVPEYPSVTI
jgi:hypothetical protein